MLQNALGGNSKTYLIAAVRPGGRFIEETTSTLRFASTCKKIKNKAIVNEDPQDKMIRELKEENDKLKAMLAAAGGDPSAMAAMGGGGGQADAESMEKMKLMQEQLEANQREMANMEKSWEEKLAEAKAAEEEMMKAKNAEDAARQAGTPHLVNLNEDPMLDRKVFYDIDAAGFTCGRRAKGAEHKLQLSGTGIKPQHCKFAQTEDGNATLTCLDEAAKSQIKINGKEITTMDPIVL
jgi:hypothetical protein